MSAARRFDRGVPDERLGCSECRNGPCALALMPSEACPCGCGCAGPEVMEASA